MKRRACFCALLVLLSSAVGAADELRLKNGDRYSGTVVQLIGGTLSFKTPHGDLAVPWADVAGLTVEAPIVVRAADGQETTRSAGDIDVSTTTGLRRPQPPFVVTGGGGAGVVTTSGNTEVNSLRVDGDVVLRQRENRYTFAGAANRAKDRGVETARNWTGSARYDRFFTPRVFVNGNVILTNDRFRDLDLRTALGAGIGYQVADTPQVKLSVEAGLGYVHESLRATPDDSYAAFREAARLDVPVAADRIVFFHQHDGYFGLTGTDNLFLRMQNGVRFGLVAGFVTTMRLDLDYDGSPAPGRRRTDHTFALTLGYRF